MWRFALCAGLFLGACAGDDAEVVPEDYAEGVVNPALPRDPSQVDRIVQVTTPQVDILWTIDSSGSMLEEQTKLRDTFPSFMAFFEGSGLDYHIGVITTDMNDPNRKGKLTGSGGGVRWVDTDTAQPSALFSTLANVGDVGSGDEKGLQAIFAALEEQTQWNDGFYRDEAGLHSVVISDENDHGRNGDLSVNEFVDWYDDLKQENSDRSLSSIVHIDGPIPSLEERGTKYIDVTKQLDGIAYDIKEEDWVEVLELLGVRASGLKKEFFLSKLPQLGTIEVEVQFVSGASMVFDHEQYTYDMTRNSISFVDFVPDALSEVIIHYVDLGAVQN